MRVDNLSKPEQMAILAATTGQSFMVALWYMSGYEPWFLKEILPYLYLIVSIIAGISIEMITIVTIQGRRIGRHSMWSFATSVMGLLFSAAIAFDFTSPNSNHLTRSVLHAAFAVMMFLFVQHVSAPVKGTKEQELATLKEKFNTLVNESSAMKKAHEFAQARLADIEKANEQLEATVNELNAEVQSQITDDVAAIAKRMNDTMKMSIREIATALNISTSKAQRLLEA